MTQTADKLSPFLATSAILHGSLFLLVVFGSALFPKHTEAPWGTNSDKGMMVGVASSLPGIPLPSPAVVTETAKPNNSKALHPAEVVPKPQPKAPAKPAEIKIPERGARSEPKPAPSRAAKADTPPPSDVPVTNAIPGTRSGQIALPYGQAAGTGKASFGGDGTFGTRFPEYVTNLIRAIEAQWTEPATRTASRVYVKFTIVRKGQRAIADGIKIAEPSGFAQLDNSALMAVTAASPTLPPLPREYSGSSVDVRFYFESKR